MTDEIERNEEKIKQDFFMGQWFYWSDWFDGYDTLVKMVEYGVKEERT